MIAPSVVHRIEQLLAEGGLSQRKIAGLTGVSRGTVGAIARGKRPDYEAIRKKAAEKKPEEPAGPPRRCPTCGGMVILPCRVCRVRKLVAQHRVAPRPARPDEPLQLELVGEHRTRYERLRARRETTIPIPQRREEP